MRALIISFVVILAIAGGWYVFKDQPGNSETVPTSTNSSGVPVYSHEVVIVLENHSYEQIISNPAMPYLNSLAQQYGLAQNYYANTHPSIGNYFMLVTGQIPTNNDNFSGLVNAPNIVTELNDAGKTWKVYAEDIPTSGYTGGNAGEYLKRHNPFSYLNDVVNDPAITSHLVPLSQLQADLASDSLPDLAWIVPNACNDAHDCSLSRADSWLKQHIEPILNDSEFNSSGLVAITFDESKSGDNRNGGGKVPLILAGGGLKPSYVSPVFYQHQNLLRTLLEGLGVHEFPGAAASASATADFFQ
jgi:hypothetical protein